MICVTWYRGYVCRRFQFGFAISLIDCSVPEGAARTRIIGPHYKIPSDRGTGPPGKLTTSVSPSLRQKYRTYHNNTSRGNSNVLARGPIIRVLPVYWKTRHSWRREAWGSVSAANSSRMAVGGSPHPGLDDAKTVRL